MKHLINNGEIPCDFKALTDNFTTFLVKSERSQNTIDSYLRSLKLYFTDFDIISKENMIEFKRRQLERNKPATAALRCHAMNSYCRFIGREDCIVSCVKIHNRSNLENVITMDEYQYFLARLKENQVEKLYWMLRYMACTGCRVSELVNLCKSCLKTGEYTLWSKGKTRKILIPQHLISESREYFESVNSPFLFPNRFGRKMTTGGVNKMLTFYGLRYGLRPEILHPHSFRHFFAIQFLNTNSNLSLLSDLLGHRSISTTSIYLRLSVEEQRRQLDEATRW